MIMTSTRTRAFDHDHEVTSSMPIKLQDSVQAHIAFCYRLIAGRRGKSDRLMHDHLLRVPEREAEAALLLAGAGAGAAAGVFGAAPP